MDSEQAQQEREKIPASVSWKNRRTFPERKQEAAATRQGIFPRATNSPLANQIPAPFRIFSEASGFSFGAIALDRSLF